MSTDADRAVPERVRFFQPVGIGFWIFLTLITLLQIVLAVQSLWLLPVALLGAYLFLCAWRWSVETWWLHRGLTPIAIASHPRYLAVIFLLAVTGLLTALVWPFSFLWTVALVLILLWDFSVPWVFRVH